MEEPRKEVGHVYSDASDCLVTITCFRKSSIVAVPSLKTPWKKRMIDRAEKKALKQFEQELKETAQREKEVR